MGDAVTEAAFRELRHHGWRMTSAVAVLALRNHFVLGLMAGGTGQFTMFEFTCCKEIARFLMAGGTIFGRRLVVIGHVLRHMRLMALFAVGNRLVGGMSLVALGAERNFTMAVMAETAGQRGMLALVVAQFDDLSGMAGYAGIGYVVAEGNVKRCMRVFMAAETRCQFVMRFALMALAAERDDLPVGWGVAIVAILTADLRFMLTPGCSDICRGLAVAFGAIIIQQLRGGGCSRVGSKDHALKGEKGKPGQYKYPYVFHQTAFFHRCYLLKVILNRRDILHG